MAGIPESEAGQVWTALRAARIRSLYFGDLLSRYTRRQQWVRGLTLGLSAGAVIAAIQEIRPEVTSALAAIVATVNIWSISTNLDQRIPKLAMLRASWESLRIDYSELWWKWYDDGAASKFDALQRRGNDLGTIASSEARWDQKTVDRWEKFVDSDLSAGDAVCLSTTE